MTSDARAAILAAIPHRPPFLFVDRIVEREPDKIRTEWTVPHDLECFAGHYPGRPILPGVLVCEFAFQSAAILFATEAVQGIGSPGDDALPLLTRIQDARFKSTVAPGETLTAALEVVERVSQARYVRAHVTSRGRTVVRLQFTVAAVARETLTSHGEEGA